MESLNLLIRSFTLFRSSGQRSLIWNIRFDQKNSNVTVSPFQRFRSHLYLRHRNHSNSSTNPAPQIQLHPPSLYKSFPLLTLYTTNTHKSSHPQTHHPASLPLSSAIAPAAAQVRLVPPPVSVSHHHPHRPRKSGSRTRTPLPASRPLSQSTAPDFRREVMSGSKT